ncbi:hypothetical protein NW752_001660 [Fusarium irregulare]|nr:hypothetical protein NW752_001660 [Fusarium irregulare]
MEVNNSRNRQEVSIHLERTKKWRILRRSLVIAGLALYYHRAEMHEVGLKVTNAWGSLILPGHLYYALQREKCAKSVWMDMSQLILLFGREQFFVSGTPDKVSDYAKLFMLQVGVSAATFAKERRRGAKMAVEDFSRAGARFLTTRASIHKSLQDWYHRNANRMNWTVESINEILLRAESKGKNQGKRTITSVDQESRISPVGVLTSLVMAMQSEVHELAFGYLAMHQMSWRILRAMRTECEPYLKETYGPNFTLKEWELPFMIGYILPSDDDESMDMLRIAGKVLDKMNRGYTTILGMCWMWRFSGVNYEFSEEQDQVFQAYIDAQESLGDDGSDTE